MYAKLLYTANQLDRESMLDVWLKQIAQLDFSRLAYLFWGSLGYFQNVAERQAFLDQARETHGNLVDSLQDAALYKEKLKHISQSRVVLWLTDKSWLQEAERLAVS